MSTALAETEAPAKESVPVDYASIFYGPSDTPTAAIPQNQNTSGESSDNGPSDTPSASPDPTDAPKPEPTVEENPAPQDQPDEQAKAQKEAESKKEKEEESQRAAARRLGREVKDLTESNRTLTEEIAILKAKLDGTYQEPAQPSPEQIKEMAEFAGREHASRALAEERYGAEQVFERIFKKDSEFSELLKQRPGVGLDVRHSAQPTLEAWRQLDKHVFERKYGSDPTKWVDAILQEHKPKLLEELRAQLTQQPKGKPAPTVTVARGDVAKPKERPLSEVFYGTSA